MIYELLGIRTSDDPELRASEDAVRLCELTREASFYFERGELDQAAPRYEDILRAFPDDPVAKSLLAMCSAETPA
jgi:adenylate cyclase